MVNQQHHPVLAASDFPHQIELFQTYPINWPACKDVGRRIIINDDLAFEWQLSMSIPTRTLCQYRRAYCKVRYQIGGTLSRSSPCQTSLVGTIHASQVERRSIVAKRRHPHDAKVLLEYGRFLRTVPICAYAIYPDNVCMLCRICIIVYTKLIRCVL